MTEYNSNMCTQKLPKGVCNAETSSITDQSSRGEHWQHAS